jgi:phage shock protein A
MTIQSPSSSPPQKGLSSIPGEATGGRHLIPIFTSVFLLTAGLSWGFYQQRVIRQSGKELQQVRGQIASLNGELAGYREVAAKTAQWDKMFGSFQEDGKTVPFTAFVAAQQERVAKLENTVQEITKRNDPEAIAALKTTVSGLETKSGEAEEKLQELSSPGGKLAQMQTQIQQQEQQMQEALARLPQQTDLARLNRAIQDVSALEGRLADLEAQVGRKASTEDLNAGLGTSREELRAGLNSVNSRCDRLNQRITDLEQALERRALSSAILREGQEGVIPGVGLIVKLQRINKDNAIDVVVRAEGSEPMQLTVPLGKEKIFDYQGGHYKITVKRIVKVPTRLRDFLEVVLEAA